MRFLLLILLWLATSIYLSAQSRWNIELTGGPTINYNKVKVAPESFLFVPLNNINFIAGVNFICPFGYASEWVLGLNTITRDTGLALRNTTFFSNPNKSPGRGYRLYANQNPIALSLGVRRYLGFTNSKTLYFYPSVAIFSNPDNVNFMASTLSINGSTSSGTALQYINLNRVGILVGAELGTKLRLKKTNGYLLFGFRYAYGLTKLEKLSSDNLVLNGTSFIYETVNRGTIVAFVAGYGFAPVRSKAERRSQ